VHDGREPEKKSKQRKHPLTYEEIVVNSLAFLGFHDFEDIDRMTLEEYTLRCKAYEMQNVKNMYDLHVQAWLDREINAEKKTGKNKTKPVYRKLTDFFDVEKEYERVMNRKGTTSESFGSEVAERYAEALRSQQATAEKGDDDGEL
jgi:hypothetical protein